MKNKIQQSSSGFTAVELLVTLFIAAAFLLAGYQLYNMIIVDGGEARARAKASNVAYDYLQQYKNNSDYIKSPCVAQPTLLSDSVISVDSLADVKVSVSITCPYSPTTTSVSKISVKIKYNNPQQEVNDATYVNK